MDTAQARIISQRQAILPFRSRHWHAESTPDIIIRLTIVLSIKKWAKLQHQLSGLEAAAEALGNSNEP
jgi:hypothetical protein